MFPTRKSLVVAATLFGMSAGLWSFRSVQAQDDPAGDNPPMTEVDPAVAAWNAPAWIMPPNDETENYRKRQFNKDKAALKANNPSSKELQDIKKVVQFYLSQLTYPDNANLPKGVVERLLNDATSQFTAPGARDAIYEEVLRLAPELMTHPAEVTRFNVVLLAASLNTEKANFAQKTPAIPYAPAYKFLVTVLTDSTQPTECRIMAARGLGRICKDGVNTPSSNDRSKIAVALVDTLNAVPVTSEDQDWWFRFRIAESLGYVNRLENVETQERIVLNSLVEMIKNPKERVLNRCQAALSLSQLPLDGSTDLPGILYEINKLLRDMTAAYQKSTTSPTWRPAFARLYLAYRPASGKEAGKNWGFLYQIGRPGVGKFSGNVEQAWKVVFPVIKGTIGSDADAVLKPGDVKALEDWLSANKPK